MDLPPTAERRLIGDRLVWLTTVAADGTPQTSLVWFLWDGHEVLVYTRGGKPKLRNVAERPRVSLAFNSDDLGGGVVVLTGTARISPEEPPADANQSYLDRYRGWIVERLGSSPEAFAADYDSAIRIRPTGVRAW